VIPRLARAREGQWASAHLEGQDAPMARPVATRHAANAAASKRLKRSTTATHVAASGVFTIPAGTFLDELQPNDIVVLSPGFTGGSAFAADTDYYICAPAWSARGTTTFKLSALPDGPPIVTGTNITAATVSSGLLDSSDGVLSGTYVSPQSPAGR
jgi:hypothetical protein